MTKAISSSIKTRSYNYLALWKFVWRDSSAEVRERPAQIKEHWIRALKSKDILNKEEKHYIYELLLLFTEPSASWFGKGLSHLGVFRAPFT